MFHPWIIALSFLVSYISAHSAKPDPTCFMLKTTKRSDDCCPTPDVVDEAVVEKCIAQLVKSANTTGNAEEIYKCITDCTAKELGLVKNNAVDKDAFKQLLVKTLGKEADFKPVVEKAFEDCHQKMSKIPEHELLKPATCGFAPYYLMNCVESEIFKNCPASKWTDSADCSELKGKINNGCPFMAIVKDEAK
ncbi:hypothetical protein pipiens_017344 [Culex pipiens pipiens]|uniref:OBP47-like domain-containing protein n=2 Tax=Culex pipiens TaxID=7175 RepID=A0ABD1CHA6_CULPP|nr:general odorant-binding protein 67-like [Culex pipiens pallens]